MIHPYAKSQSSEECLLSEGSTHRAKRKDVLRPMFRQLWCSFGYFRCVRAFGLSRFIYKKKYFQSYCFSELEILPIDSFCRRKLCSGGQKGSLRRGFYFEKSRFKEIFLLNVTLRLASGDVLEVGGCSHMSQKLFCRISNFCFFRYTPHA